MTEKGRATTLLILVVLIIIAAVGLVAANNRAASHDTGEATAGITPHAFSTTPTAGDNVAAALTANQAGTRRKPP